jgi:cytochrome oxidase Cu insertion factor (SCO1/SenC/PrrC family)
VLKRFVNVWTIAFLIGAAAITALPFMQKRFLKAPPPIAPLGPWTLKTLDEGRPMGAAELSGRVLLLFFAPTPCDAACVERQATLARGADHTDDLGDVIRHVTITRADNVGLKAKAIGRWHVLAGTDDELRPVLASFHAAWARFAGTDAGVSVDERLSLPAVVLVDQNGDVRGFWRDDAAGRGNAINAARLLAKHGPNP